MNARLFFTGISVAVSVAACVVVFAQRNELSTLRNQKQKAEETARHEQEQATEIVPEKTSVARPSAELLELRSRVTQLMARKNQLAATRTENEQLRSELNTRGTNSSALPPDYIRARDAQWVGTSTIENTIQSFFWALRNRDTNALFQVLTPRSSEQLRDLFAHSQPEDMFKEASVFPGMRIAERKQLPDGKIEAQVEMLPGKPELTPFRFELVQGQWKLDLR